MIEETLVGFTSLLDLAGQCPAIFFAQGLSPTIHKTKPAGAGQVSLLFRGSGTRIRQISIGIKLGQKHSATQLLQKMGALQFVHDRAFNL